MAQSRLELQALLEILLGSPNVYFQPPESVRMQYPAIVYHRDYRLIRHADNAPWQNRLRYLVTVIDRDPDSPIPSRVADLPMCSFDRFFTSDDLNHDVFRLYF
jgi:hypothetical protein